MKEAAGEANLTVITVILIGVVAAVAIPLINTMMENTAKRSCCTNYGGSWTGTCTDLPGTLTWGSIWSNGKCQ